MDQTPQEINGTPPEDENGVDLSLIDYCLSLTPTERLRRAQEFATFILETRRRNGIVVQEDEEIEWQNTHRNGTPSSND